MFECGNTGIASLPTYFTGAPLSLLGPPAMQPRDASDIHSSGSSKSSGHGGDSPPLHFHEQYMPWSNGTNVAYVTRNDSTDSGTSSVENLQANALYFEVAGAGSENDIPINRGAVSDTVLVPSSEHVAEIVGRQGCKIKALRAKTNTYIKTPVRGEEPVFVITGKPADVSIAKKEIEDAADHFTQIRASRRHSQGAQQAPGHVTAYVRVPFRVVGLVVGPKGATIKRIQQETHTYIITPGRECDPLFEVTGLPHNVNAARALIEEHILARTGVNASSYSNDTNTDPSSVPLYATSRPMDAIAMAFAEAKQPAAAAPGEKLNGMPRSILSQYQYPPCGIDSRAPMPPMPQQNYNDDHSWSTWSSMDLMNGLRQTNTVGASASTMIASSIWSNDATPQIPSAGVSLQQPASPPTPCNVHIDQKDDLALHFLTKCLMQDLA